MTSSYIDENIYRTLQKRLKLSKSLPFVEYLKVQFRPGIRTGAGELFLVDTEEYQALVAKHQASKMLLKPFLRAPHVKNWHIESPDQWLVYVPWMFPIVQNHYSQEEKANLNYELAKNHPAIHAYLEEHKSKINSLGHTRNAASGAGDFFEKKSKYALPDQSIFEQPKIVINRIARKPTLAYDQNGYFNHDSTFSVLGAGLLGMSILSSRVAKWCLMQVCSTLNSSLRINPTEIANIPICSLNETQRRCCEWLADALIFLSASSNTDENQSIPIDIIKAYFEQWLNGLIYESYFTGMMHKRGLYICKQSAKFNINTAGNHNKLRKMSDLTQVFKDAYELHNPLRAMLFNLPSLDIVRMIEGE